MLCCHGVKLESNYYLGSKPHAELIKQTLMTLRNIAQYPSLALAVVSCPDGPEIISETVYKYRESEDLFLACIGLLRGMASVSDVCEVTALTFDYK